MNRKEKRDILLSMLLGDGCLAYSSNRISAGITIGHCAAQKDYLEFKRDFLSAAFDKDVKVRETAKGKTFQLSLHKKRFKAWRKFIYKNGKKDISRILPFIINPQRALAFWLMDDGYVEPSKSKLKDGSKVSYGGTFRIFTCDQSLETHDKLIEWFYKTFDATPIVRYSFHKKQNKNYPFLKFNTRDSLSMWEKIREFVLITDSMKWKFRYMEAFYQKKLSQRTTDV